MSRMRSSEEVEERVLEFIRRRGTARPSELRAIGMHPEYMLRLFRRGVIQRTGRGTYELLASSSAS